MAPDHPLEHQPGNNVALPFLAVVDILDGIQRNPHRLVPHQERDTGKVVVALWV